MDFRLERAPSISRGSDDAATEPLLNSSGPSSEAQSTSEGPAGRLAQWRAFTKGTLKSMGLEAVIKQKSFDFSFHISCWSKLKRYGISPGLVGAVIAFQ